MYMGGVVCICVLIKLGINRDYRLVCVCVCVISVYFTIINSNVQHSKCFTKAAGVCYTLSFNYQQTCITQWRAIEHVETMFLQERIHAATQDRAP